MKYSEINQKQKKMSNNNNKKKTRRKKAKEKAVEIHKNTKTHKFTLLRIPPKTKNLNS